MRVEAPVATFTGVVAGVTFADGQADTSDPAALAYFRRHGYKVGDVDHSPDVEEPTDPRHIGPVDDENATASALAADVVRRTSGIERLGTPLRDAAVNPQPEDFLAPTNAGEANPHGPEVVSPEIHGSQGVRPVAPGAVPAAPEQDPKEAAHATAFTAPAASQPEAEAQAQQANADAAATGTPDGQDEAPLLAMPKRSGSHADWVTYAISRGADPDEAAATKRDDLVAAYGGDA